MNLLNGDSLVLLHNPNCSKSNAALQLLNESGLDFSVREYLADPLDEQELLDLGKRLDLPLSGWVRDDSLVSEFKLVDQSVSDPHIAKAMAANPALMQRPILVRGMRAVIGRPTEGLGILMKPQESF